MTEQPKWALRRTPTVPQEAVQLSDGRWVGVVNNCTMDWYSNGRWLSSREDQLDLVPLRPVSKKALRFFARRNVYGVIEVCSPSEAAVEMIDRAPGDALAAAVRDFEPKKEGSLGKALRAYEEATE